MIAHSPNEALILQLNIVTGAIQIGVAFCLAMNLASVFIFPMNEDVFIDALENVFANCTVNEKQSYNRGPVTVWAGISASAHTELHLFEHSIIADVYVEDVLIPYVIPYAHFIGENFFIYARQRSTAHCVQSD